MKYMTAVYSPDHCVNLGKL